MLISKPPLKSFSCHPVLGQDNRQIRPVNGLGLPSLLDRAVDIGSNNGQGHSGYGLEMDAGNKIIGASSDRHIYPLFFYLIYTIGSITSVEINIYIGMSPTEVSQQRWQVGV